MTPIKKVRLVDSVIDAINELISEGRFKPGDKFYSENELTRKFEVSRSSIREAIRILEVTGQVNVKQGKGIFIADRQQQRFKTFSAWLKNSEQEIKDHFEVRLIIEPKTARYAAEKADKADIEKLDEAYKKFLKSADKNDTEAAIIDDGKFHRLLAEATKNTTLHVLMKAITKDLPTGWVSSLYTPGRLEKTIDEHGDILEAVKKGDASAAENAMTLHLASALRDITRHLNNESISS
jgi:GntR family transcriptional repressor for pyruvate dehydrogenase complex